MIIFSKKWTLKNSKFNDIDFNHNIVYSGKEKGSRSTLYQKPGKPSPTVDDFVVKAEIKAKNGYAKKEKAVKSVEVNKKVEKVNKVQNAYKKVEMSTKKSVKREAGSLEGKKPKKSKVSKKI